MPFQKRTPDIAYGRHTNKPDIAIATFVDALNEKVRAGAQKAGEPQLSYGDNKFIMWCPITWENKTEKGEE
jgi:hypothetical protein